MTEHRLPSELLERPVIIHLVGCGGNGSQVLSGLARLDRGLRACGHPGGLRVVAFDPDDVSEANVGRQLFAPADLGQNKAAVLVTRLNCFYSLGWEAAGIRWRRDAVQRSWAPGMAAVEAPDILISCVDTAAARREIHAEIGQMFRRMRYWLDLGNEQQSGQVILGEPETLGADRKPRLPTVVEVFPELLDASRPEDDRPSCSLAEALESQDLFINQHVATWALQLLWVLFRKGRIAHHGAFINLSDGSVNPLPVPAPRVERKERARVRA